MFGKIGAGECLPNAVIADVGDLAQSVEQSERQKNACIDADADVCVAGLDLLQGGAGREGALGHDRHGQASASTGVVDVRPEFTQRPPHGGGRVVRCGHLLASRYKTRKYVARSCQFFHKKRLGGEGRTLRQLNVALR